MTKEELAEFDSYWDTRRKAERQNILDELKQAQERVAKKDEVIEELKFERELIFKNLLDIVNEKLRVSSFNLFMGFTGDIFWKAWRWCCYKDLVDKELENKKITDDEYKSHKTAFELTTRIIEEKFFGDLKDKVEFKEIIRSWTAGYDYIFIYKDQEIIIFIPTFYADKDNLIYALNGYCVRYKASEACQDFICGGLEYEEVADKLQKWMLEESWKISTKVKEDNY